jgi:hypothetical protein
MSGKLDLLNETGEQKILIRSNFFVETVKMISVLEESRSKLPTETKKHRIILERNTTLHYLRNIRMGQLS